MSLEFYKHQKQALDATEGINKVAYYLDMGLGKTFVGAEKLNRLGEKVNIIVCQKSLMNMWKKHFKTYYSDYTIYNGREVLPKPTGKKMIIIINYELTFRRKELLKYKDFTLLLDESSLIQNPKAKRTKFILKMNAKNIVLLSGTPVSGKYENLWAQANLIGWNISEKLYQSHYVNWTEIYIGGFPQKTIDKDNPYKNEERLKQKLRDNGAVFMKTEEVFDLPKQVFIDRKVELSKEYKEFDEYSYIDLGKKEIYGDMTLNKRLGLRQLAGIHAKEKLELISDIIQSTNDRLIVFYNFTEEMEKLSKVVKKLKRPLGIINGTTEDLTGYDEEDGVMLIQYQAGAYGLNLQKANNIIYYSPPEHSELYEQSKKRIHRIGQEKTCFYYKLIMEDSIEEDIYEALKQKKDYTDDLFKEVVEDDGKTI